MHVIIYQINALLLALLAIACPLTAASRILAIFPAQSPSHYILVQPLLQQLAVRGHEITAITPYPQKQLQKNYRDIVVLKDYKVFLDMTKDSQGMRDRGIWQIFELIYTISTGMSHSILQQQEIQQLMTHQNETFDLIIADVCADEALFGFAAHFQASIIGVAPFGAHIWNTYLTGAPMLPAFMPHHLLNYDEHMSFFERVHNFYAFAAEYYFYNYRYLPALEEIYNQYFAHTGQTFADVRRNFSLVLLNQHSSLGVKRPYLPNMIEVGGMQVPDKIHALPADMQQFLNDAKEGAIYFSLGSNIKSETMSPAILQAILNTFRALPQRVLWKFELTNVTQTPANVFISSWFPQSDVLAHSNVKLFITHGGLLSITESIVRGKPVLGIPFFADQFMNVARAEGMGFALSLNYNEFSESQFRHAIEELLSNRSYALTAQTISQRFHDKPQTALQAAVFWVEYVLRHRGAQHLRCAGLLLNMLQYYGLDVLAFVLALVGVLAMLLVQFFSWAFVVAKSGGRKQKRQ